MRSRLLPACSALVALVWTTSIGNLATAQSTVVNAAQVPMVPAQNPKAESSNRADQKSGWRLLPAVRLDAEYDDNVFYLSATKKAGVAAPSSAELISGRYADMTSPHDVITTWSGGLNIKGPGLMGKPSVLTPEASFELYAQNMARSNLTLGLSLQQELWAAGRLRFQGRLTPSYFGRNYLADAVDQDLNGSISDAERVYDSGEYREGEFGADYRLPLVKTREHGFGASVQLGGGYYDRSYGAPFAGRDLHGPTAGARLLLDLGRNVGLDLGYDYSSLGATPSDQVVLLDEPDYGQDLNGNGNATDLSARVLTMVDRSRTEHSLGASLRFAPSKPMDIRLGYERRWRRYTSNETLDPVYSGRRDDRNQVSGDIRFRLTRDLRLRLGGIHSIQKLNRAGDPAGEIDDYKRSQGRLGLSYEL